MSKIKVSDLKGEKLAEWVARAHGWSANTDTKTCYATLPGTRGFFEYRPDINSGQAMELVKSFGITIMLSDNLKGKWYAYKGLTMSPAKYGETPEIAICRAVVSSVFGEYIGIENEDM